MQPSFILFLQSCMIIHVILVLLLDCLIHLGLLLHHQHFFFRMYKFTFRCCSPSCYNTILSKEITCWNWSYANRCDVIAFFDGAWDFHDSNIICECSWIILVMFVDLVTCVCSLVFFSELPWVYSNIDFPVWWSVFSSA